MRVHITRSAAALAALGIAAASMAADIAGTYTTDTTIAGNNTWTGGNLTISGGVFVTIPAGSTLVYDSGSTRQIRGGGGGGLGTLRIQGTMDWNTSNNITTEWASSTGGSLSIEGVLNFKTPGAVFQTNTSRSFLREGGTINVDLPNPADLVTIQGGSGDWGRFNILGGATGAQINVIQGRLHLTENANSEGGFSEIDNVDIAVSSGGHVLLEGIRRGLSITGPVTGSGDGWVEIKGRIGTTWSGSGGQSRPDPRHEGTFDIDDGTSSLTGGGLLIDSRVDIDASNIINVQGKTVWNSGELNGEWDGGPGWKATLNVRGDPGDATDQGVMHVNHENARLRNNMAVHVQDRGVLVLHHADNGGPAFDMGSWSDLIIEDGGSLKTEGAGSGPLGAAGFTGTATIAGGNNERFTVAGQVRIEAAAGTTISVALGDRFGYEDGAVVTGSGGGLLQPNRFKSYDPGRTLILDLDDGTASATSGGVLVDNMTIGARQTLINQGKMVWTSGNLSFDGQANSGNLIVRGDPGDPDDQAALIVSNPTAALSRDARMTIGERGTLLFTTAGTWTKGDWGGRIDIGDGTGGTLRTEGFTGTRTMSGSHNYSGLGINTGATIDVGAGTELRVLHSMRFNGATPGSLGGVLDVGTYKVAGTLSLVGSSDGSVGANFFSEIGPNASVMLVGPGASFDAIDAIDTMHGSMGFSEGNIFTTADDFTVGSTFHFGLSGSDESGGATLSTGLSVSGLLTLAGDTTISIFESDPFTDPLVDGLYRLMEYDAIDMGAWAFTLDVSQLGVSSLDGTREFSLTVNGDHLLLGVVTPEQVIPEPGSVLLLALGGAALAAVRRRRRTD